MHRIIRDLLTEKMNIRKLILWIFTVFVMLIVCAMLWRTYLVYEAVTDYWLAHPESIAEITKEQSPQS